MAVNPLNPTMPYSINASNEASDNNSRQRQEKNPSKEMLRQKTNESNPSTSHNFGEQPQTLPVEPNAEELTSQIIDSGKVIELLSHRPKLKKSVRNCFSSSKNSSDKSQIPDIKKFNKAF